MIGIICMPIHRPTNYVQWLKSVGIPTIEIPYNASPIPYLVNCKGVVWIGGAIENKFYDP